MAQPLPRLIGRYEVQRLIGTGGMGDVYLARDPMIDRLIAIKVLREGIDSPEILERFSREARSAGRLHHPHIVTIFDVGEHERRPFIAMEFVQGSTLATIIERRPAVALVQKLRWMEALCAGLQYAHKAGIVHRDMKPANVIVEDGGSIKILDFGIAHIAATGITRGPIGTLNYMAPEQIDGHSIDPRTDIFSLGALFYELVAYRRAFEGDVASGTISKILLGQLHPLESVVPDIDPALAQIISRCLELDPKNRFPDCVALARDIESVRAGLRGDEVLTPIEIASSAEADTGRMPHTDERATRREELRRLREEQIRTYFEAARKAVDDQRYDEAIAACDQVLLLDPDHVDAQDLSEQARLAREEQNVAEWTFEARRLLQAGNFAAAGEFAERAFQLRPHSQEIASLREVIGGALRQIAQVATLANASAAAAPGTDPRRTGGAAAKTGGARAAARANASSQAPTELLRRYQVPIAAGVVILLLVAGGFGFARWRAAKRAAALNAEAAAQLAATPAPPPADTVAPPEPDAAAAPPADAAATPTPEPPPTAPETPQTRPSRNDPRPQADAETKLWVSIANSKSASDYEGYLSRYPNGTFADLARGRIEQLAQERAREEQAEADRQKAAADERARNEAIERDKAAAAAAMQRAEEDRKNLLPVVFKVRHNHSGFGSVFGGGSDCQGELQINKALKTVAYTTSTKDSFQAKCADLSKIGIKKDDNVDLMDFTVGKRRFTFASLSEGHTAKEIVDLISSTCGATP